MKTTIKKWGINGEGIDSGSDMHRGIVELIFLLFRAYPVQLSIQVEVILVIDLFDSDLTHL